jgi:hypothetical protein
MSNLFKVLGLLALAASLLGCGSKSVVCPGALKYSCIVGGCNHDVVVDPTCYDDGTSVCPSGSVAQSSCGGCIGDQLGCACGDGGSTCADAAAGQ